MSAHALLSAYAPLSASTLTARSRVTSTKVRVSAPGSGARRTRGSAAPLRVVARGLEGRSWVELKDGKPVSGPDLSVTVNGRGTARCRCPLSTITAANTAVVLSLNPPDLSQHNTSP